jgi:hypothetical protein
MMRGEAEVQPPGPEARSPVDPHHVEILAQIAVRSVHDSDLNSNPAGEQKVTASLLIVMGTRHNET